MIVTNDYVRIYKVSMDIKTSYKRFYSNLFNSILFYSIVKVHLASLDWIRDIFLCYLISVIIYRLI